MTVGKQVKKKICYICYRNSPETNFEHLSKAVSENGYDVTIISLSEIGQQISELLDGRKIHRIPIPASRLKRKSIFSFISKTVEILNSHDFSIVHIDSSCPYFSLIKILTSNDAKFIYHVISHPISHSHLQAVKRMKRMFIIFIQSLFMDKIIVQSEELKEKLIGIRTLKRTKVVPVGFNKKVLYPIGKTEKRRLRNSCNIPENDLVLVYCGVISQFRQLDKLITAFRKVHEVVQNVKLLMVGDGDALEEVKTLARSLQIQESIIFTGRIRHDKVVNYIAMADIGISYVPINENYNYNPPLKTFEYLACGLPTIATRTESNCRIINDGYNGLLVCDDPKSLACAIITLLGNSVRLELFRTVSRRSIMDFDFEHITKSKLIPVYERLLEKKAC